MTSPPALPLCLALVWLLLASLIYPTDASAQTSPPTLSYCERYFSTAEGHSLGTQDLPWEITSAKGESYLPDLFYAEPLQNRQIMPTELTLRSTDGNAALPYQIHHLIYPTLGNPNLYDRSDKADALMVVLRLPPAISESFGPPIKMEGTAQKRLTHPEGDVRIYLASRAARGRVESTQSLKNKADAGSGLHRVHPSCAMLRPLGRGGPRELGERATVQLIFDHQALKGVPAGLYDVRVEWGALGADATPGEGAFDLQYNAVRIFDTPPGDAYTVLNVADSQASVSDLLDGIPGEVSFRTLSERRLKAFVDAIKRSENPAIQGAAFIAFNGDLHNGGSPGSLLPETVAQTYQREAEAIVTQLRELPLPIFLTVGNHDGYASTGSVPDSVRRATEPRTFFGRLIARIKRWRTQWTALGRAMPLREVVMRAQAQSRWPSFDLGNYINTYLPSIEDTPGGWHRDLFSGVFSRRDGRHLQSWKGWERIPDRDLNPMLYDGFNQWRRTYGPLYFSHIWGDTHYVSLNTYDLRQHRRTGWGMYTVNYGGGMSPSQGAWLNKQLGRSQVRGNEVTILAHHDPRGGHMGEDFPYYFEQVDYQGMVASTLSFIKGEVVSPVLCGRVEGWPHDALPDSIVTRCLHDGLQEWMRPDAEFDCAAEDRDPDTGLCKALVFDAESGSKKHPVFSGFQLLHQLATRPQVRTLILGHTHYNSVEILQPGDALVPTNLVFTPEDAVAYINQQTLDDAELTLSELEVLNPLRRLADPTRVEPTALVRDGRRSRVNLDLAAAGHSFERILDGHELVVLRMTTVADLSTQLVAGNTMTGFAIFHVDQRHRPGAAPQINAVQYHQWSPLKQGFKPLGELHLNRGARWGAEGFEDRLEREARENP